MDYRDGFGDFKLWNDEFWLGNEHIYSLLSEGQKSTVSLNLKLFHVMSDWWTISRTSHEGKNLVKIDLMDWDGQKSHAFYENFRITDESVRKSVLCHFSAASGVPSHASCSHSLPPG